MTIISLRSNLVCRANRLAFAYVQQCSLHLKAATVHRIGELILD